MNHTGSIKMNEHMKIKTDKYQCYSTFWFSDIVTIIVMLINHLKGGIIEWVTFSGQWSKYFCEKLLGVSKNRSSHNLRTSFHVLRIIHLKSKLFKILSFHIHFIYVKPSCVVVNFSTSSISANWPPGFTWKANVS